MQCACSVHCARYTACILQAQSYWMEYKMAKSEQGRCSVHSRVHAVYPVVPCIYPPVRSGERHRNLAYCTDVHNPSPLITDFSEIDRTRPVYLSLLCKFNLKFLNSNSTAEDLLTRTINTGWRHCTVYHRFYIDVLQYKNLEELVPKHPPDGIIVHQHFFFAFPLQ